VDRASVYGESDDLTLPVKHRMLDVNATKVDGSTALLVACRNSRLEVVCELLKNKEVDVNSKTVAGITISPSAGRHGHIDVLLALRKYENADASA
jgi:ankyrin repeat protein